MTYTTVLFDLDGTLVDSERLWADALSRLMVEEGISFSTAQCLELAYGLAWVNVFHKLQKQWPEVFEAYTSSDIEMRLSWHYKQLCDDDLPVIQGSYDLLLRFSDAGYTLGIVSGSPRDAIENALRKLDIVERISVIVSSDDVTYGKPHPESYQTAMSRLGVTPESCIVFEDSNVGTRSARAANIYTVAYRNPTAPQQDLTAADLVLEDLSLFTF